MFNSLLWPIIFSAFGAGYKWQLTEKDTHDFSSTSVTSGAWVELTPSTSRAAFALEVFNGQGNPIEIGFGASGSELAKVYVFAGGLDRQEYFIPSGTRLSMRAVSASATTGNLYINLFTNE